MLFRLPVPRSIICATAVALLAIVAMPTGLRAETNPAIYEPVLLIGAAKPKSRIVFVWDASEASRAFYQGHIRSVVARTKNDSSLQVALIQRPISDGIDDRGPGSLLLCAADASEYAKLAMAYLTFPFDVAKRAALKGTAFYINDNLSKVFSAYNIDVAQCVPSQRFLAQVTAYLTADAAMQLAAKPESAPLVYWNHKRITPRDSKALIELDQWAGTP